MTVHPEIIKHLLYGKHELSIEISHLKIHIFNYGLFVVLEIYLAALFEDWLYLIPGALFLIMGIINTVSLIKSLNDRQSLIKTIALLMGDEEEE